MTLYTHFRYRIAVVMVTVTSHLVTNRISLSGCCFVRHAYGSLALYAEGGIVLGWSIRSASIQKYVRT
jgi:hypothetical protein